MASSDSKIDNNFYTELFTKSAPVILVVFAVAVWNLWFVKQILPIEWAPPIVFSLASLKTIMIIRVTFHQLSKIILQSHILTHVVVLFALLIGLIIFSFASDFTAFYLINENAFQANPSILNNSTLSIFFDCMYFSTVTFSAIGYGDIVPSNGWVKALIMLEVILYFFVLVFGIANINGIKIDEKKHDSKS